ncbi:hypothetical protein DB30_04002 [Enhygromyxa salina]|uniref:Dipeptide-binding ABC transporter, periplasmic substrate-binding component n=1 Tax=Enhygromyxa salina TaxID=215803 RepID=A0A0C2D567_9BACT|nr:hypothetical protein DB30_04002 [Enhygromyxa salina]
MILSCSLVLLAACVDGAPDEAGLGTDATGEGDGDGDPGDGDGDPGDGDGDPQTGDGDGDTGDGDGDGDADCSYPLGAVEPMAVDEVITPYSWPAAIHGDGTTTPLALLDVPCNTDAIIDWSPHELLVFISIPAW